MVASSRGSKAGRKPYPDPATRKIQKAITIAPETDAIITSARKPDESYSATIDRLVQESRNVEAYSVELRTTGGETLITTELQAIGAADAACRAYQSYKGFATGKVIAPVFTHFPGGNTYHVQFSYGRKGQQAYSLEPLIVASIERL